jgi:hypothetical protein
MESLFREHLLPSSSQTWRVNPQTEWTENHRGFSIAMCDFSAGYVYRNKTLERLEHTSKNLGIEAIVAVHQMSAEVV